MIWKNFVPLLLVCSLVQAGTPFGPYSGEWKGEFHVYTPDGKLVKNIQAWHVYKVIDEATLSGLQTLTYQDGTIEKVHATNYIKNGTLYCRVSSDRFGDKELQGRFDGNQIFWWRMEKDIVESYRERILNHGKTYAIDGYGIYGSKIYTFFGEYTKVR
jgi:hypothetical protein